MTRGSAGGRATLKKYGVQHFKELGKRGFQSFTNKYFGGNKQEAMDYLHLQATERQINGLVEQQMAETGETCIELPVIMEPEDDPTFREPPSWRERVKASRRKAEEVDLPF